MNLIKSKNNLKKLNNLKIKIFSQKITIQTLKKF